MGAQADSRDYGDLPRALEMDEIRKNNGEPYSDYSKDKFWSTISKFYSWFIKKEGKGYNEAIDGPELLEDLEIKVDLSVEVDPDRKPTPEEVKEVAKEADNLLYDRLLRVLLTPFLIPIHWFVCFGVEFWDLEFLYLRE